NFRFETTYPTYEDVNVFEYPEPPENIVHKPYSSTEEYIETHFHLLRADCMLPVRDAIRAYRNGAVEDNEMVIYIKVRPVAVLFANIGVVHRMSFVVDGRRVNWRQTKRLVPGSIVCLSTDQFEHFRFATVVERDLERLQNPRDLSIGLKFLDPNPQLDFERDICYTMIESMQGYYEAYRHILKCLQDIEPDKLPFKKHLVGLEPDLDPPMYSSHIEDLNDRDYIAEWVLEFPKILRKDEFNTRSRTKELETDRTVRPNVLDAMVRMLTKEFAVIQGPPGTGKTYLGLLTTYLLLEKCRTAATGPIIVICQTNHALDQFLEGIMKFEDRIIRLGSRSKSPIVKEKTLYNIRKYYKEHAKMAENDHVIRSGPGRLFKRKDRVEKEMLELLEELSVEYVPLKKLLELNIISQAQFDAFAFDGWVTRQNQEENPTAESWLKAAPEVHDPEITAFMDDTLLKDDVAPEIDEEELEERVEEFVTGTADEGKIYGNFVDVKKSIVCHVDDDLVGSVEEFFHTSNVHDIPGAKRLGVYKHWLRRYQAHIVTKLGEFQTIFNLICDNIRAEYRKNDESLLKTARVIGMTTTAASKYHELLYMLKPKIMLCEEASETMEAHLLSALTPSVQHFILIGDHEQLRPSMSVNDLRYKNIDVSLFERLVRNDFPFTTLDCQRRMRPEIRNLLRPIYHDLVDHESVHKYDDVRGMVDNLWFLTHDEHDSLGNNNSFINSHEVGIATRLAIYLLQQGYAPSEITILAMYSGQRNLIQDRLRKSLEPEADKIRGMYILGNGKLLMEESKLWGKIIGSMFRDPSGFRIGNRIKLQCTTHPEMISEIGLESEFDQVQSGGCSMPCGVEATLRSAISLTEYPHFELEFLCLEIVKKMITDSDIRIIPTALSTLVIPGCTSEAQLRKEKMFAMAEPTQA
ncbi:NFX1-type zinc finger-containing protein 1, partial [Modicella reniformis]